MASYKILWKKSALKELKKINGNLILKIVTTVENLSKNPFPNGVKKLETSEFTYRIRVGDYRIIYSLLEKELVIEIIRIGHRKEIYRRK
ncbi:MAG: type II toxin-antitoxin system RelE/ParE family toxin [Melioribacteraceae bacterium]|nr:MAG: type II toxin-antitoxin system RelE/ParE family toxin [Melioribacteraceae bacterium]